MSSSRLDHPVRVPDYAGSKQERHSPAVNTVSSDDEKDCARAKIALEYYNKENGTSYELACPLLSNGFQSDGNWVHCNFAAWQRGVVTSSRRLFFAEMHGDDVTTWTVAACIVLEGATTVGCSLCSEVIHPTHGFHQGHPKPKISSQPAASYSPTQEQLYSHMYSDMYSPSLPSFSPMSELPCVRARAPPLAFPNAEQVCNLYRKRAGIALEYYNQEKGANYELVDVLGCNAISSGSWFHCNFTACNGDISSKLFFGEICLKTLTATACVVLEGAEGGKTSDGCCLCPDDTEVIHPSHGFAKGLDEKEVYVHTNPKTGYKLKLLVGRDW